MSAWETYEARLGVYNSPAGDPKREVALQRFQFRLQRKITASLSYHKAVIDGMEQKIAVRHQSEYHIKKIYAMPGEALRHGAIVQWANTIWMITEVDPNTEALTQAIMERCNYLLKWIDRDGHVIQKHCIVSDGTKYLIGEKSEDIMTIGDARIAITISKDDDTMKLNRGQRFLVDDPDADEVLAYQITKPNKFYNMYDGKGVYRFILNEVNVTDNDNIDERIADYYSWKPKPEHAVSDVQTGATVEEIVSAAKKHQQESMDTVHERTVWL